MHLHPYSTNHQKTFLAIYQWRALSLLPETAQRYWLGGSWSLEVLRCGSFASMGQKFVGLGIPFLVQPSQFLIISTPGDDSSTIVRKIWVFVYIRTHIVSLT